MSDYKDHRKHRWHALSYLLTSNHAKTTNTDAREITLQSGRELRYLRHAMVSEV
jgi:hypothetical protein